MDLPERAIFMSKDHILGQQLSDPQTYEFGLHRIAGAGGFLKFKVRQEFVCLHGLLIFSY